MKASALPLPAICTFAPLPNLPKLVNIIHQVANRFVEDDQRIAANRTCKILRAPWWDIVKGETPGLLQRKTVTMYNRDGTDLVERKNPFRKFCFSVSET